VADAAVEALLPGGGHFMRSLAASLSDAARRFNDQSPFEDADRVLLLDRQPRQLVVVVPMLRTNTFCFHKCPITFREYSIPLSPNRYFPFVK